MEEEKQPKRTLFGDIINGIRRFLRIKKKVIVDRVLKESEIESLSKELEWERGYKEAQLALKEREIEKLKNKLGPDKEVDIKKFLSKQAESLHYSQFEDALSIKKLFEMSKKKKHIVSSYDAKRNFGEFEDIYITSKGHIALVVKTKKGKDILIVGKTIKDIFYEFKGLSNTASLGHLKVNLTSNKDWVENVLDKEIQEIVIDGKGKMHISQINTKSFMEQLIGKEQVIGDLTNYISALESTLQSAIGSHNLAKIQSKYNKERAETAETETLGMFKSIKEIMKNYYLLAQELSSKGVAIGINEDELDKLEDIKNELLEKLGAKEGKETKEVVEENFQRISEFLAGIALQVRPVQEKKEIVLSPPSETRAITERKA